MDLAVWQSLRGAALWRGYSSASSTPAPWSVTSILLRCLSSSTTTSSNSAAAPAASASSSGSISSGGAAPASVPVQRLQQAITPAVCDHLRWHGFAVVDGVFGEEAAAALRQEVAALRQSMHKNHTHLVHGGRTGMLEKEHIWEAELAMQETQELAPLCTQLQKNATLWVMLNLLMPGLTLHSQAIKLQYNAGSGGCFPMHFDTDAAVDTRRVTAICYFNPGWQPGHGGELRLYPFPQPAVDIQPLNDRLVLFSSMHMLHRVLPSAEKRYCFTIWMSEGGQRQHGGGRGGQLAAGERGQREELQRALSRGEPLASKEAWQLILHPCIRKHAAKLLYHREWEQSVRESHPEGPDLQRALETFWAEMVVVGRALAPLLPALMVEPLPVGVPLPRWF